jgi:hypothetical protein
MPASASPSPDSTTQTPPRRKRWMPVSLKLFLAFLVLFGVSSVLLIGVRMYRQRVVIRAIEQLDGYIVDTRPLGPEWLGLFHQPTVVSLNGTHATDATLEHIAWLSALEELWLDNTSITDSGLRQFEGLANLHSLNLGNTKVTDAGLRRLTKLPSLERVCVTNTRVTTEGVAELKRALPKVTVNKLW